MDRVSRIKELIASNVLTHAATRETIYAHFGKNVEKGYGSREYPVPPVLQVGKVQFVFPQAKNDAHAATQGLSWIYIDSDGENETEYLLPPLTSTKSPNATQSAPDEK